MNKYEPLTDWLMRQVQGRVESTFEDIEDEDKIGVKLPRAAREHRAWWANEVNPKTRHYQCRAWTEAGWGVEDVDVGKEIVVFVRIPQLKRG
jgi:hypothetical protein